MLPVAWDEVTPGHPVGPVSSRILGSGERFPATVRESCGEGRKLREMRRLFLAVVTEKGAAS